MQIVVLGMHRSGTSMLTGLLHLMGCYVAPKDSLLPCDQANPRGYWERWEVLDLNESILKAAGAAWNRVADFEIGAAVQPRLEDQGRSIVEELDRHRPWVVKDPRMCLVLAFWRRLLERPICVLVHRSPLEVAQSLKARDGTPLSAGIALWEKYTLAALENTKDLPRVLVLHREILDQPLETAAFLYRELIGLGVQGLRIPDRDVLTAHVDRGLFHQRTAPDLEDRWLTPHQTRLRDAFRDRVALSLLPIPSLSPMAHEVLIDLEATAELGRQSEETRTLCASWEKRCAEREQRSAELEQLLEQRREQKRDLADQLDVALQELARKELRIREVRTLRQERDGLRADLEQARLTLLDREQALGALRLELDDRRRDKELDVGSIARLESWIHSLDGVISAILDSHSWKLGSAFRKLARRLLFRRPGTLAADRRDAIMNSFGEWRARKVPHADVRDAHRLGDRNST